MSSMPNTTPLSAIFFSLMIFTPPFANALTPTYPWSSLAAMRSRCGAPPRVPPGTGIHGGEGGGSWFCWRGSVGKRRVSRA